MRGRNYRRSLAHLPQAASEGYVHAQYLLALSYAQGLGVRKDPKKAIHWYRPAARKGHPGAVLNLPLAYEKGQGTLPEQHEAFTLHHKDAKLGDPHAHRNLGA